MSLLHREPRPSGPPAGIDDSGTAAYTFIWGMCGENITFDDMDFVPMDALK